MRAKEFINEMTSAGGIAVGAVEPLGDVRKRKIESSWDSPEDGMSGMDPDEYVEIQFNNESAYEAAINLLGDHLVEPNYEQMFIHERHLDRLEDEMMSRGFDEPEDYIIGPADPQHRDYHSFGDIS